MQVTVRLFALAKQVAGRPELNITLPEHPKVADLRQAILQSVPELTALLPNLLISVDSEYAGDEQPIPAGAEIALIPPVSGGSEPLPTAVFRTTRLFR